MYHTLAWTGSVVTATTTDLAPLADGIIQVQNSHFLPPQDMSAFWAIAYGTNLQRAQINTPRLRQRTPIYIRPIQPTLIGASNANSAEYDRNPQRFRGQEEIQINVTQNAGANQQITVVMGLGDNLIAVPPGDVYIARATSTTALVANTWTQITYTMEQNLPAGRYAVVLIEYQSTNAQAIRANFDNQYWRPGCPGMAALGNRLPYWMYEYSLGVWGYFYTYSLPRIELLANGADAAHELYIHLIPLAG